MIPIRMADQESTLSLEAVMQTRPARMPLVKPCGSRRTFCFSPVICYLEKRVNNPPAEGARIVFIIALSDFRWFGSPLSPIKFEDPALKQSHPSHRIRVPSTTLWGAFEQKFSLSSFVL
jgi:hypothetical protein